MFNPKVELFAALNALEYYCAQGGQTQFAETPAITFRLGNNSVNTDLDNEIVSQDIVAVVDIWADDSPTASGILAEVEEALRAIGYRLSYSADVPSPEGALYHINTRFETIR
jgi:hypothetical protein